mmetsp:Transcript_17243/g.37216  ORF Transcript_17243/g.37216 Transcript_17243/m.37216 type:complete len:234 (+) Transcript_17243:346-1047(+)
MFDVVVMGSIILTMFVFQQLEILRMIRRNAGHHLNPMVDALHDHVIATVAPVGAPCIFAGTPRAPDRIIRSIRLDVAHVLAPLVFALVPQLDHVLALLFAQEIFEGDHPRRLVQIALPANNFFPFLERLRPRVNVHRVVRQPVFDYKIFIRLVPWRRRDNPLEHGVQLSRQETRPHVVSQGRTALLHVDHFAGLAGRRALRFHVGFVRLAFSDRRPKGAKFLPVSTLVQNLLP